MKIAGGKDVERTARRQGMHLTVEMWFADCEDLEAAFLAWIRGIKATAKAAHPSWVHIRGTEVPEPFQEAFEAVKSSGPVLRVVK